MMAANPKTIDNLNERTLDVRPSVPRSRSPMFRPSRCREEPDHDTRDPCLTSSRSISFEIFPVLPIGSELRNSTNRGYLFAANCVLHHSLNSLSERSAPSLRTRYAL